MIQRLPGIRCKDIKNFRRVKEMTYSGVEHILSKPRLTRYLIAGGGNKRLASILYKRNIRLSHELFGVIGYFEIALRNKIDQHYISTHGDNWIRASTTGMFSNARCAITKEHIIKKIRGLAEKCTHDRMVAEMDFGFWRFMFATNQFTAGGSTLLKIFPHKPKSNKLIQYNHSYVFDELRKINGLRNRIAHHEPICFREGAAIIDTTYARRLYKIISELFQWMDINETSLLYAIDHVLSTCNSIDTLKSISPLSLP